MAKKEPNINNYSISFHHKIKEVSFSGRLNDWEKKFITCKQVLQHPSTKQKALVEKMYQKYVVNYVR